MKFYGVRRGRKIGIFETWEACRAQVHRFPGAEYKAFSTREEAEVFISSPSKHASTTQHNSTTSPPTCYQIWVDGSCFPQADGSLRLGWGFLVKKNGIEIYRSKGNDIPRMAFAHRNVAGEITAILKALQWCQAQDIDEVTIYYDYQGLQSWATGDWRTNIEFTQAYTQAVKESGVTIHWVKVKAHSGNVENEIVDKLAKEAAWEESQGNKEG